MIRVRRGVRPARLAALVALAPLAAGAFTLESAEIKPGATIAEAQVDANQVGKATFTGNYGRK